MERNGIESGICVECSKMVYVDTNQFKEDGNIHIHWRCKPENKKAIEIEELRSKLHAMVDEMSINQLQELTTLLYEGKNHPATNS